MPFAKLDYTPVAFEPSPGYPQGFTVRRPNVSVIITGRPPDRYFGCLACLYTGADGCTFPPAFARKLGFKTREMDSDITHGITGPGRIYFADVDIAVLIPLGVYIHKRLRRVF